MNSILALMEMDSPDKFAEDVANAYFTNPTHVRRLLNADCIEECVNYVLGNQQVEFDLSDLNLFEDEEPLFAKPSRQRGRRKHDKKEVRRKGNTKRFRDRSRKHAHGEHINKVYLNGMSGDWGRRGRRLEEAGVVSTTNSHKIVRDIVPAIIADGQDETRIIKYEDGTIISCTMNKEVWIAPIWDEAKASYTSISKEWETAEFEKMLNQNPPKWKTPDDNDDRDWLDWEDEWENDDDEIIDEPAPTLNKSSYDTSEFTAMELAQMSVKLAYANPDQRAWIREFMKTL